MFIIIIQKDGSVVKFKDLGPQIGYKFVFVAEYAGPIVFVLLWYYNILSYKL